MTIPVKHYKKLMPAFAKIQDQIKQIHIVGCNDKKHVDRIIKLSKQDYGFEKNKILVDIKGEYTADESTPGVSCQIPVSCENYEKIVIKGNKLRNIENDTFITLPNVKHITLPPSIIQIQFGAFDQCHKLESITLSNAAYTLNKMMLEHKGFKTIQSDKHGYVTVTK